MYEKFELEALLRDLYNDKLVTCFNNGKISFSFYENSEKILAFGKFDLCERFAKSIQLPDKVCKTQNKESDQTIR